MLTKQDLINQLEHLIIEYEAYVVFYELQEGVEQFKEFVSNIMRSYCYTVDMKDSEPVKKGIEPKNNIERCIYQAIHETTDKLIGYTEKELKEHLQAVLDIFKLLNDAKYKIDVFYKELTFSEFINSISFIEYDETLNKVRLSEYVDKLDELSVIEHMRRRCYKNGLLGSLLEKALLLLADNYHIYLEYNEIEEEIESIEEIEVMLNHFVALATNYDSEEEPMYTLEEIHHAIADFKKLEQDYYNEVEKQVAVDKITNDIRDYYTLLNR